MILSDIDIKKAINSGQIKITPKPNLKKQLGTCSLDLRLSKDFKLFGYNHSAFIDVSDSKTFEHITESYTLKKSEPFVLHPGQFILGSTIEDVTLPNDIAARLEGRSRLGRLGLIIHSTAGHIDPGWSGRITLEITNIGKLPIILHEGNCICHLVFEPLTGPVSKGYSKKKENKWNKPGNLTAVK
ncbi:MAG: dCTP deaminase [Candidatus Wolfebacteria bacterium]|nr:dCTP deaminase [Candidatus Wolfebacteria bacterium]